MQGKYADDIALDTVFVHSSLISMVDAAVEEAVDGGGWYFFWFFHSSTERKAVFKLLQKYVDLQDGLCFTGSAHLFIHRCR